MARPTAAKRKQREAVALAEDDNCSLLEEYFRQRGSRESVFQQSQTTTVSTKRGGVSRAKVSAGHKRRKGLSTATTKWSPPAGSWEDDIESIAGLDEEDGGKRMVYLAWKNGRKTKHPTTVVHSKCPQKMLQWYEKHVVIVRSTGAKRLEELEYRIPGQAGINKS
ncbi:hypothetical protein Purlil1_11498 [Purpureocillium lilacinum]|uniref:Chromo shadow domain-containing protein n=1 Tax=Purpureocillium lilacinum TaxID=33203 RepID=A0ABR0BJI5_PURLI|nr:hypothetical protein Purlil1_11498 [Purpureocillium lilacinum]